MGLFNKGIARTPSKPPESIKPLDIVGLPLLFHSFGLARTSQALNSLESLERGSFRQILFQKAPLPTIEPNWNL